MNREDAIFMADVALSRAGLTAEQYARAKGLIVNDGTPRRLFVTTEEAQELLCLSESSLARRVRDDRGLRSCRRKVGQLNLWHLPSLERWAGGKQNKKSAQPEQGR